MYCIDFEYDGHRLSDFRCMICEILNKSGTVAVNPGSQIIFNTVQKTIGNKFELKSTQYDTAYTTTFEICKFDCEGDKKFFTEDELVFFARWLNRKTFKKLKMIYKDGEMSNTYFNGSFNIEYIRFYGDIIGLQLTLNTDAPFGYYDEVSYKMEFSSDNLKSSFYDISDEIGYLYPISMDIEILESGDFELINSQESDRTTIIKNCKSGEVISFVNNLYIQSSINHDKLYNDFNSVFPRISNQSDIEDNRENIFTVNHPCIITFNYSPICKMGIV